MTADDRGPDGRAYLSVEHPLGHRAAWEALLREPFRYPLDINVPPWKRPTGREPLRRLAVAELDLDQSRFDAAPRPTALRYADESYDYTLPLSGGGDDVEAVESELLGSRQRGRVIVVPQGARRDLVVLLGRYARPLVERGWRIYPSVYGSEVRSLRFSRGRQSVTLTDWEALTGLSADWLPAFAPARAARFLRGRSPLARAWLGAARAQHFLWRSFGVGFHRSAASTAVAAASRHLPEDWWLWRPPWLLVTLCRAGGAYRGGYVYAARYRGPAHKVDVNRLYTHCLRQPLPLRAAFGECAQSGDEQAGIYVCTLRGYGLMPAYIARFDPTTGAFAREYWNGRECTCVLPSAEFAGLRELGFAVEPGYGCLYVQELSLSTYVDAIDRVLDRYGRHSPYGALTKTLGNAVYGKWGQRAARQDICYSLTRPGADWQPFATPDGVDLACVWERWVERYQSTQQVGLAATVAAAARNRLYSALARVRRSGGFVAAVDTDSIICDIDPRGVLVCHHTETGAWRYEGFDPHASVLAKKRYAFGTTARLGQPRWKERATLSDVARSARVVVGR